MHTPELRISALSSGVILLDGKPIEPVRLDATLRSASEQRAIVRYYQEPTKEPPSESPTPALALIIKHKLPISLSSRADFGDYLDAQGTPHPRSDAGGAHADLEQLFAEVRRCATSEVGKRSLVIVRPDRKLVLVPVPTHPPSDPNARAAVERMIPSSPARSIAVIADTSFTMSTRGGPPAVPSIQEANRSIPFFGMLLGFASLGHALWVFDGHPTSLAAGCRDADVLIVDSAMLPALGSSWKDEVSAVLRNRNILVHDRKSYRLVAVR